MNKHTSIIFSEVYDLKVAKELKHFKELILLLINDINTDFDNYNELENKKYFVQLNRDKYWKNSNSDYFCFWYENSIQGKYLKYSKENNISLGFKSDNESYIDFFITDKFYKENEELVDSKIGDWVGGFDSIHNSSFVTKHNEILPYLLWRGSDKSLPEYLFIDFDISKLNNKELILNSFINTEFTLKDIKKFIKVLTKEIK